MSSEEEYMTLDQAAVEVGLKKASLYYYIRELKIETRKFQLNKHKYIARKDVERIKILKQKPWIEEAA